MQNSVKRISGNIVDVLNSTIYAGTLEISDRKIKNIKKDKKNYNTFIIPGFIDSHLHVESSMLVPSEFARLAVTHGTVAIICDPHEIANVMGMRGVNYMIGNAETVPLKIYFGVPSCVPATSFETSGAEINPSKTEKLFRNKKIKFLAEVMNFEGVLNNESDIVEKIQFAMKYRKLVDGHAPGLRGKELEKYAGAGISTDHESVDKEEAMEKIKLGMKIQIREGSVAKNFDVLSSLIEDYPNDCMLCCDDKLPHDLLQSHINEIVKRAIKTGIDKMKVLKCACINPVLHYRLDVGLLQKNNYADFLEIDNFQDLNILKTYINGEIVASDGKTLIPRTKVKIVNNFKVQKKKVSDFFVHLVRKVEPLEKNISNGVKADKGKINIIKAIDGQLFTKKSHAIPKISGGNVVSDINRDILKIVVVNRYRNTSPAIGFIKNFGFKKGAIASSVAHDSHNIVAVGVKDEDICKAVNLIIENKGGVSVVYDGVEEILPLPVAGIMSAQDGFEVAREYSKLNNLAKGLGSKLKAPFMTLSFMALLVIPEIKLSDKGLFDSEKFKFINLFKR
jgi:adenine deaminase